MESESGRAETVFGRLCDNCCISIRQAGRHWHALIQNIRLSFALHFHLVLSLSLSSLSSISLLLCVSSAISIGRFLLYFLSPCPSFSHSFHRFSSFARCDSTAFVIFSPTYLCLSLSLAFTFSFYLQLCHYYYHSHWPREYMEYVSVTH